jgi:alkanesulfonate monooxygenase SsuD/methylene tetrahydromethanopterin reductase-like flavin-dependent oxidoreductase (luciferase family)
LAACAARTSRIRIGHGVVLAPPGYNHPARVAERIATLDLVSDGRVDWGTGESASRVELEGFGIDPAEKKAMWAEAVEQTADMMAMSPYPGFQGKFFSMPVRNVVPKPLQKPHPPIWVACLLSPESFEWTAQEGYNLLYVAYHVDHPIAVERIGWYRDALRKHGRRIEDHEVCCVYHAHFTDREDDDRLQQAVHKAMGEYAAAGLEAARKPPDPTAYKGYEQRRRSAQVRLRILLSRTRIDGRAEAGDRTHPCAARRRHHPDRDAGRLRLVAAGADHAVAGDLRQ